MKRFVAFLILLLPLGICAQKETDNSKSRDPFGERLFFSGILGLTFGDVTYVELSPQVGYMVTDQFITGVGITYIYYDYNAPGYMPYKTSMYGGSVWARYHLFDALALYSEYQILNVEEVVSHRPDGTTGRTNVPIWLVGGGYTSGGDGIGFQFLVLWDVISDVNSPYGNPIFRAGVYAGF